MASNTIVGLAAGSQALGGLFSGIAGIRAGGIARDAGERAREAADANALVIEELGRQAASEERRVTRRLLAKQRVGFAKSGVVGSTGSALDILLDTALEGEVIAMRAKFGFDSEAFKERLRGIQAEFQGDVIANNALASGLGTILGGVSRAGTTLAGLPAPADPGTITIPGSSSSPGFPSLTPRFVDRATT